MRVPPQWTAAVATSMAGQPADWRLGAIISAERNLKASDGEWHSGLSSDNGTAIIGACFESDREMRRSSDVKMVIEQARISSARLQDLLRAIVREKQRAA